MPELHIVVQTDKPEEVVSAIKGDLLRDEQIEWHVHEHDEGAPGGVIVGWEVLVTTSHESHSAALTHADIVRQSDPAADVELQPVIGNPPGEEEAA